MNLAFKEAVARLIWAAEDASSADAVRDARESLNNAWFALHEAQDALNGPHHVEQRLDAQFPEIRL